MHLDEATYDWVMNMNIGGMNTCIVPYFYVRLDWAMDVDGIKVVSCTHIDWAINIGGINIFCLLQGTRRGEGATLMCTLRVFLLVLREEKKEQAKRVALNTYTIT